MASSDDGKKRRKKSKKTAKKSHKSSCSTSPSSSHRKHKKRKKSSKKKEKNREGSSDEKLVGPPIDPEHLIPLARKGEDSGGGFVVSIEESLESAKETTAKPKGPMTKEEWEKQRQNLRRVYDPQTQRTRLIRGNGEIVEEIVSRDRHMEINKAATRGDGAYYETVLGLKKHV